MIRTPKQTSTSNGLNQHAGAVRLKAALLFLLAALALAGAWWPLTAWLILLAVLAPAWGLLARARWGRDQTWIDGAWTETGQTPWRAGVTASDGATLREPDSARKAVLIWCVALAALLLSSLPWWLDRDEALAPGPLLGTLVVAALLLLALHTAIRTRTRRLQWDEAGMSDADFFGTHRVPWQVMGELVPDADKVGGKRRAEPAWTLHDVQGRRLMRLDVGLVPPDSLVSLRQRIHRANNPGFEPPHDMAELDPEGNAADDADHAEGLLTPDGAATSAWTTVLAEEARRRSLREPQNIMMLLTMVLVLLPFLLGTLYLCWTALGFSVSATRVEGKVVAVDRTGLASLLIEYRVADGRLLRLQTDGSDQYASYGVGAVVDVLYHPGDPADARADLFLELWLLPMLLAGLTLLLALAMGLIAWGMTRPFKPP